MRAVRELRRMELSLSEHVKTFKPKLPDNITIRTFDSLQDNGYLLALNARAFASHPEQGGWTERDVRDRQQQDWYNPQGLFLAFRDKHLVGFHWTKIEQGPTSSEKEALGEFYVVGIDPSEQGRGLGKALTLIGLHHLKASGIKRAELYVDADNSAAVAMYESLGFRTVSTDTMYTYKH
jgi:mycothiol synthase